LSLGDFFYFFIFSYGVDVGDQESREDNVKFYPTATCGQVKKIGLVRLFVPLLEKYLLT